MGTRGFSLVELVVTMAIAAILVSIGVMQFNEMSRKSAIEEQVKKIHVDLAELRQKALYEKTERAAKITATEFATYPGDDITAVPVIQRRLVYPMAWSTADNPLVLSFDTFGMSGTSESGAIFVCIEPTKANSAAVDSLIVSPTRVDLGKRVSGGSCVESSITLQ
ncbi:Tfp pilus assembly protein FimT/FimU [Geobacter sp. DSM 9736]|uniref:pilus assembly FimT family protein n=1 Tax=Geobacter sp. DSM 9736 TaxID=1277350 RepID=UPI000B502F41|nr:prepilin-type N-terminal cleavage/methylation domain-containing protein [Geobacter sp. DSM 9736]SNB46197.1 type IV fimbrial biogenesis protein FimT/type IV fimbrial biogenesis protein FimU [Geobacter sp. DSM 9736]